MRGEAQPLEQAPRSLGVIGGGPKALMALVELDAALDGARVPPMPVVVYDPDVPGAGRVWRTDAPPHRVMNVDATLLDCSGPSVPLTYRQWEAAEGFAAEEFPPRSRVARYLAWSFERLTLSPRLRVRHHPRRVRGLRAAPDGWQVEAAGVWSPHSHVLLATGHAGTGPAPATVIEDPDASPREQVAVVGAALTGLDVVLDLTAGRGGRWVGADGSGLRYLPSGAEPAHITLVSRSGELMMPKPCADGGTDVDLGRVVQRHTATWPDGSIPDERWWEVLVAAAVDVARHAGRAVSAENLWVTLRDGRGAADPWQRWEGDVRVAQGRLAEADAAWFLGRAWSAGYADVVRSLARAPRVAPWWWLWRERSARLERWAFGPPVVTVQRMLALRDAGLLSVRREVPRDQHTILAVTDAPGIRPVGASGGPATDAVPRDPLWRGLCAAGIVTVRAGERGVLTDSDARCVDPRGGVHPTLAALGRPTEDPTIGNDTLSRTLHPEIGRWARATASWWTGIVAESAPYGAGHGPAETERRAGVRR